jgi:hypothetical protein
MSVNNINDSINITITISILLSTAITFFMDKSIFLEGFPQHVANWYGITIVFLVLSYIFLYLNHKFLNTKEIETYHKKIMVNLGFMVFSLFFIMYPRLIDPAISIILVVICITINLIIPGWFIFGKLLFKTFLPLIHKIKSLFF